nr:glycosyltransferase family 2 protein [uncultured Cohaesibacter sp.]
MPKFSVITINYNNCDGLKETLERTCAQSFRDFEIIVIDGWSDDCSSKVLEDMDSQIDHWLSEADSGIYDAMNKGAAIASGEYVIFMNSGDSFASSNVLKSVNSIIANNPPALIYGRALSLHSKKVYQYNDNLWQGMICSHQATFAPHFLLELFPFDTDFKIAADYNFYVQCDQYGYSPKFIDIDIALIDTTGVSFEGFSERTEERMKICRTAYPEDRVYENFRELFRTKNLPMPEWAKTKRGWRNGPSE